MAVTDLTGTTWVFNNSLTRSDINYNVSGTVHNATYTSYDFEFLDYNSDYGANVFSFYYYTIPSPYEIGDGIVYIPENPLGYSEGWYFGNQHNPTSFVPTTAPIIKITDGTDVTNSNLISWLQANATQVIPSNEYLLTYSLTNLTNDNVSLTITADEGYNLPSTITITDGTLVSWDSTTGVAVISGYGANTTVSVECTAAVSTIEFTISTYSATYQAESGMTWGQWVASAYNTGGYSIVYNSQIGRGGDIVAYNGTSVFAGDEIVANRVYYMVSGN